MMGERGGLLGAMTPQPMNIVPPSVVRQIDMPVNLPKSKEFFNAVTQEPSAAITPEGLLMNVKRQQVPDQSGMESVRTGVFYLPESQSASVYKGKQGYGGSEPIQGSTLYKNPLFVKGATGGKAPESAYDQLLGKGSYQAMRNEALDVASGYRTPDFERVKKARAFLEKYGGDPDLAEYIVENSKYGNQLTYALQENAVANAVRNAGHDAVLGYSKGRGDKGEFFSEVFDVREQNYPTPQGDYQLMPQFESLLGAMTPQPMRVIELGPEFQGKRPPKIENLARTSDKFLFHSSTADKAKDLRYGIEPQAGGPWVREVAQGAVEGDIDNFFENVTPLAWFSDKPEWIKAMVGRKLNKSFDKVTADDIEKYGHLAFINKKSPSAKNITYIPSEGLMEGSQSKVFDIQGNPKKAWETGLYQEGNFGQRLEPFGIERNEYVSPESIEPLLQLTGSELVQFMKLKGLLD